MYENGLRSSRTYLPSPQFVYSSLVYCFHRGIYFPISLFEFIFVSKKNTFRECLRYFRETRGPWATSLT